MEKPLWSPQRGLRPSAQMTSQSTAPPTRQPWEYAILEAGVKKLSPSRRGLTTAALITKESQCPAFHKKEIVWSLAIGNFLLACVPSARSMCMWKPVPGCWCDEGLQAHLV
ncbi:uncharacterized protein LOC121104444 isoform X8 [Ursus maritimus]|uniref:Uncharacterized protein LOC121104444 isoform X8 n=1 Tax=Ursus maritimus TaxID=29073 RepID=A0A8M1GFB4_URSMA|nr:uncharacterized protein LOC121104444 isoform X8 [Ursus maritimus]XP_040493585.1 uncharacterized protein LOC121104444 isoform X8 [Ursus maritimus]